jgi:hypothetical protein
MGYVAVGKENATDIKFNDNQRRAIKSLQGSATCSTPKDQVKKICWHLLKVN